MKLNKLTSALMLSSALLSQSLYAQESNEQPTAEAVDPDAHRYSGNVGLGFLYKTGDVKSYDITHRTNITHEFDNFKNNYIFDVLYKETEQEIKVDDEVVGTEMNTTDQKWFIQGQTNYTVDTVRKNYLFGFAFYEDNRFSNFDFQSSVAGGWGKRWWEDLATKGFFDAEIGPGISYDKVTNTGETNTDFIIRASATFEDTYYEKIKFRQILSADLATESDKNTKLISESQFTTQLIGSLAARFSIRIDYNSEVDENQENTNTETNLALVYNF